MIRDVNYNMAKAIPITASRYIRIHWTKKNIFSVSLGYFVRNRIYALSVAQKKMSHA